MYIRSCDNGSYDMYWTLQKSDRPFHLLDLMILSLSAWDMRDGRCWAGSSLTQGLLWRLPLIPSTVDVYTY